MEKTKITPILEIWNTMTDAEKREAVAELLNMEGEKNKDNTDLDEIYN